MLCWHKYVLVCPILIGALAACSVKPVKLVEPAPTEECVLVDAQNGFDSSVSIAITAQSAASPLFDPREKYLRFTHKQLFETLISNDCLGQIRPGLASSWKSSDQGTLWTFHLRENARFWDSEGVTAPRIVRHWIETIDTRTEIDSIVAGDDRTVLIHLGTPSLTVPSVLASPLFAAKKSEADQLKSIGTGRYWHTVRNPEQLAGLLESNPFSDNRGPDIEIIDARSQDERDLFSENVDLFMTSDPDVIDYANSLDTYQSLALPWEKTYVLLSTTRVIESDQIEANDPLPRELTHRLATEAVRTSSRGFESPLWWNSLQGCPSAEDRIPRRPRAFFYTSGFRQILFDENDDIARSLADRIVALSAEDADRNPDTAALLVRIPGLQEDEEGSTAKASSPRILAQSLEGGDDFAYVIPLHVDPFDACLAWSELMERIPWLPAGPDNLEIAVVPLVDVRPHVIVRRAGFGLVVDGFGYLTITSPESGR